jgi:predicted secreted protein
MKREASDKRSQRIVVVSHCILNVHSLEDELAIYPGLEEEVIELLIRKGTGLYQIPCPEIKLSGIFRKALPKDAYDHPKIRKVYRQLAERITSSLNWYVRKDYRIEAVLGAEGSPTCGVDLVGKWKEGVKKKREFPRDIEFVPGTGVFIEEFKSSLDKIKVYPEWIGIPGKSIRSLNPKAFEDALKRLDKLL